MNKRSLVGLVIVAVLVVAFFIFYKRNKKEQESSEKEDGASGTLVLPNEPLPDVVAPTGETKTISNDDLIVVNRMKLLFNNEASREAVLRKYSVRQPSIAGEPYPSGVYEVLTKSSLGYIPLIPEFIQPLYKKEVEAFVNQRPYEEIAKNSGKEDADNLYSNSLTFTSLGTSLFPYLKDVVFGGGFGTIKASGNHARGRYWDMETAINSLKKLFSQAVTYSKDLENALREQAIEDLISSGYKVIGYGS